MEQGFGSSLYVYEFVLRMSKDNGTRAELEVWADQIRAHFDGQRIPAGVTGLLAASVQEIDLDNAEGEGPDVENALLIAFTGQETP